MSAQYFVIVKKEKIIDPLGDFDGDQILEHTITNIFSLSIVKIGRKRALWTRWARNQV